MFRIKLGHQGHHKTKRLALALVFLLLFAFPVSAAELERWEIYNKIYEQKIVDGDFVALTSNTDMGSAGRGLLVDPDEIWPLIAGTISLGAVARARYAGYNHEFGYYQPTGQAGPPSAAQRTLLFDIDRSVVGQEVQWLGDSPPFSAAIDTSGGDTLGFFLHSTADWDDSVDHLLYSESALNPERMIPNENLPVPIFDGGDSLRRDHMLTYLGQNGDLVLFWEDLIKEPTRTHSWRWGSYGDQKNPIDWDFNDLAIQITPEFERDIVIPEPGTLALVGIGLLGMARKVRKRSKRTQ